MNVNLGIWDKLTRLVVCLLVLAGAMGVALSYWPLIQKNERMRREIQALDVKIKQEEETARQLKTSIDAIRTDPRTVERLARETLRYAKPGETIFIFQTPPAK